MKPGRGRLRGILLLAALGTGAALLLRVALYRPLGVVGELRATATCASPPCSTSTRRCSDGGGTPDEVIRAARETGVAVLGINDHNNLDAKPFEGYRDGVLVLVGSELSTPAGHVLGVGLDRDPAFRFNGDGLDALEDVRHLGGIAFAAHPLSPRADLRFTGFDLPGSWGLELLNGDSDARRAGPRLLLSAFLYRLNPDYALLAAGSRVDAVLERWDALLAGRDVTGLAGSDAHSRLAITRTRALRFPSYQALFRQARNHLLLAEPLRGDARADRAAVLGALAPAASTSAWTRSLQRRASHSRSRTPQAGASRWGTRWTPQRPCGRASAGACRRACGSSCGATGGWWGRPLHGSTLALPGPGVYRVEAWVPGWPVPWVITNPVYVFDRPTREARRQRAAWPGPPPPPRESAPLTLRERPALHAQSTIPARRWRRPSSKRRPAPGGADAFRLGFLLAPPGPGQPFTWCALVNREARDLGGWSGLRFRIRADGEYRLWIQLRDPNPASADEGLEWWMASARTSTEWSEVQLPFARFRTLNPRSDGRLDPDQTQARRVRARPRQREAGDQGDDLDQ